MKLPFPKKIIFDLLKKIKIVRADWYLRIYYEYYTGKQLDLENPVEFNAKIQWIKLNYQPEILTQLADKYEVRDYVKAQIGSQFLNPLLGVYESVSTIDFEQLPHQFVLKATHSCNNNLIVKDKTQLHIFKTKLLLYKWLSRNYYYKSGLEWAYKNIKPRIICEKLIEEPGKEGIDDYKFYCFNGIPKFIQVDSERKTNNYKAFYDLNWNLLPFTKGKGKIQNQLNDKPSNLEEMLVLAIKLAGTFPFVRVDFYSVNGQTIFGEMTFYPGDGRIDFYPQEYNKTIGDYLTLPEISITKHR